MPSNKWLDGSIRNDLKIIESLKVEIAAWFHFPISFFLFFTFFKLCLQLSEASQECVALRDTLSKVEIEYDSAKTEVRSLTGKVRGLESVLEEMHRAGENR